MPYESSVARSNGFTRIYHSNISSNGNTFADLCVLSTQRNIVLPTKYLPYGHIMIRQ